MRLPPLLIAILFVVACDGDELQAPLDPANVDLTVPANELLADTAARIPLRVVAQGNFNPKVVVLRTTAGRFFPGNRDVLTAPLDVDGTASVLLQPPLVPGVVVITATAGGTTITDSLRFAVDAESRLLEAFNSATAQAPADGMTGVVLEARLTERGRRTVNEVTFTSTAGRFVGGSETVKARVDQDGVASAILVAPETPGVARVHAQAGTEVLGRTIEFQAAASPIRSISASSPSAPADGASVLVITVRRNPDATHVGSAVLDASAGAFLPGGTTQHTVLFDAQGNGLALLRTTTQPGVVLLRASYGSHVVVDSVRFVPALPDVLHPLTGPAEIDAASTEPVTFSVKLQRFTGTPSRGIPVRFSVTTEDGRDKGTFLSQGLSDDTATASARWVLNDSTFTGRLLVSARTLSASGDTAFASYPLTVVRK